MQLQAKRGSFLWRSPCTTSGHLYAALARILPNHATTQNFPYHLSSYILRNGNVINIKMGDSEVATEKLLHHISRLGRTNYSHRLLATMNHLILSCRPRWQLPWTPQESSAPLCLSPSHSTWAMFKYCQRHNGPKGRVQLTKVTCLGHTISSYTNHFQDLDQASISKSQSYNTMSTKPKLQNIDQI